MKYHLSKCLRSAIMKAFVVIVSTVILASILLAFLKDKLDPNSLSKDAPTRSARSTAGDWPRMGEYASNIFWMVQVSDIHISNFRDLKRGPDLIQLCQEYLTVIQPQLFIITGDLTDAKAADDRTSQQHEIEWRKYQQAIEQCKTVTSATILDTRGNHDAFNIPEVNGDDNFYRKYSVKGQQHALSYHHVHSTPFGKYSFIAVDACPIPGPHRPFNFFGYLDEPRVQQLRELDAESRDSNLTVWFGHYPTSIIVQDPPGIRHVMRRGVAYLCGHLHTLGDLMPRMYSRQKTGMLELELGDWKINRKFRVLAIDHDLLSFVDAKLGEWPLILVTNPKDAQFLAPHHEPVESIKHSTHIRILVFSLSRVRSVEVYADDGYLGRAKQSTGPLYTLAWLPQSFSPGLHSLRVDVEDITGTVKSTEQRFSVDGTTPGFDFWPRFVLMLNIYNVSKVIYGCIIFGYVLLFSSLRQCSSVRVICMSGGHWMATQWNKWANRLWLITRHQAIYYTLLAFLLYITFGPWFVGDLLTDHTGVLFVWGTFVKGTFLAGSLSYIYGIFQIVSFNIPLTLIIGAKLDASRHPSHSIRSVPDLPARIRWQSLTTDLPFSLLLCFQIYLALTEFPRNYGTTAMVVSPVRLGSVLVGVVLFYLVNKASVKRTCAVNGLGPECH